MKQELIELFDLKTVKVLGHYRWLGKAKLPGYPNGQTMLIFEIKGEYIAIPNACPHEGQELLYGRFVSDYVIECPLHYNIYNIRSENIKSYKALLEGDKMFILRDSI